MFVIAELDLLYFLNHSCILTIILVEFLGIWFQHVKWQETKFGGNIRNTLAVRIVGCWNKVSVQVIRSLWLEGFENMTLKYCDHALVKRWISRSLEILFNLSLYMYHILWFLCPVFFMELALQRYSDNMPSDNHAVIFREQQRQVCSLR